ncbi:MAG: N-acetylmuramic acid 6-phosphate etherase [Pseudanabaena sp. M135S2SP2A07QC]|nr:N-acetylmuramic acid 6-phosphate etherase [Pseudanabaena sp. M110S1SP2A07QC]MCA6526833.1 N-acetylmuramic acid 6-phosphate etherase [Pseudanabaena sp. M179S2SP2A07QC]MCA6530976.1 N-acetylmuramic acid 6-phosphate etherase [Pseudanabaena sp. M125S2SP2A07QC]MCA6535573.1 N-acetylmuramic acid 6-phosphate etherase [Pseudanabaena sp. M176S2SP2A07QC]MCA6540777.1 N-acetylmuramic acid 6-phosphate etherase [Pseudanabaena sp. M037S2SP2A07QC]MCA6545080.1 N-acetylmuramic acid 6-phosphate etherase [Pseudan
MNGDRGYLLTEQANPHSQNLDRLSASEIVELFNREDAKAVAAVGREKEAISAAITCIAEAITNGGRLFYVGAGTSGRLGVLDAAECPPTFCSDPELIQGILAGGMNAMVRSSEALEDREDDGADAIAERNISDRDVVFGITAGGTTPYVHGALKEGRKRGAKTIFFCCVPPDQFPIQYDIEIRPLVGAEILAGSTRLKAGTATKLVLNTVSTGVMVQLGKVYGNRMIDVSVTNSKLEDRAIRIIRDLTSLSREEAAKLLERSGKRVKLALLMHWKGIEAATAEQLLQNTQGHLGKAMIYLNNPVKN